MSMFDNIAFLEGEQAEEYKARKAKEKEEARDKEEDRVYRRNRGSENWYKDPKFRNHYKDQPAYAHKQHDIHDKAVDIERKNNPKGSAWMSHDDAMQYYRNIDGIKRHMRRHPDQYKESGLFESVQFIND